MQTIYLDHNATTPVDPRVLEVMLPYLREHFGNASSKTHAYGWKANEAVEAARAHVAALLGADPREVIFTSGATEANNIALLGLFPPGKPAAKDHVITHAAEHHAVLDTVHELERRGIAVTVLRPDARGRVSPEAVARAITPRTAIASIMAANNEVGTVNPIAEIGKLCRQAGILFHTDAAQAAGKIPLDVEAMGIDLLALSAHKFYGPKGVGALYVRSRRGAHAAPPLHPLQHGGGQERGLRPGTLNVPGIAGLGEACRLARADLAPESERLARLRDRLEEGIRGALRGVHANGDPASRLPGTTSLSFEGVDATSLIVSLPDLAISAGSACTTGNAEPSYVLKAMGIPDRLALATVRFAAGRFTTGEEIETAVRRVTETVEKIRGQMAAVKAGA
jgi:cysteine desulfurase